MSALADIALFLVSLAVTFAAARFFARRLDRVGLRLGLPETLLGLLTALAADSPEVTSAIAALVKGAQGVSVGVVIGSNVFNLAAMVGMSAILCNGVRVRREALAVEGGVGLAVTGIAAALIARLIGAMTAVALCAAVLLPYLVLLGLGPHGVQRLPIAVRPRHFLRRTFGPEHRPTGGDHLPGEAVLLPALLLVPALAIIVAGSSGMVEAALRIADRWDVPRFLMGVLVLAVLTSLPNAFTGLRLGFQARGSALLSETLNSNTINLMAGVAVPALLLSLGRFTGLVAFDLVWLGVMTVLVLAVLGRDDGAGWAAGAAIIGLYAVFVAVQIGVAA